MQVFISGVALVYRNAEFVFMNFLLSVKNNRIFQLASILENQWEGYRKDYMVLLGQTMLRRVGDIESQSRGLRVIAQLAQTDVECGHKMGIFGFIDELNVEEDIIAIEYGNNERLAKEAKGFLKHFTKMDKEALIEETSMFRSSTYSF